MAQPPGQPPGQPTWPQSPVPQPPGPQPPGQPPAPQPPAPQPPGQPPAPQPPAPQPPGQPPGQPTWPQPPAPQPLAPQPPAPQPPGQPPGPQPPGPQAPWPQAPGPQQVFAPQPNFLNFIQGLNTVVNEAALIPNIPLVGQADQIIQLLQRIAARLDTVEARLVTIEDQLNLHPTQLFNSGAREYEPFIYPPGVTVVHPPLPVNRRDLGNMTIAECQAAAAHLGLPALPGDPLIGGRRRQIAEYLGAPLY